MMRHWNRKVITTSNLNRFLYTEKGSSFSKVNGTVFAIIIGESMEMQCLCTLLIPTSVHRVLIFRSCNEHMAVGAW